MEKTWEIPGGFLVFDSVKTPIKTKQLTRTHVGLTTLYFRGRRLLNQDQANKVAAQFSSVGLHLVATERQVEVSCMGSVKDHTDAYSLIDAIVDEINAVLTAEANRRAERDNRRPHPGTPKRGSRYLNRSTR